MEDSRLVRWNKTGWSAVARSPDGGLKSMFGSVVTTEAHLANAGARTHSNNTAELSGIIEALSFLGPDGPVACDAQTCIFYDSKHAANICLGTIHFTRKCPSGIGQPASPSPSPIQVADHHAAHLQSKPAC